MGNGSEITGAVRWLAPECIQGKLPSSASDVYAFGMTIYEALVGKTPYFHISKSNEVTACKLAGELPLREPEKINDEAWDLIQRSCDLDPLEHPTMEDV
uniref:Protein kinase domain-containing protein n=1 Tax=Globisporangium ultimum (strain ATCC 200006 / CBS 805.95 / DAOM BR144) TaxID=431595 RepID=K3WSF9_GLOUD